MAGHTDRDPMSTTAQRTFLLVVWAGGGNVTPFLCLAENLRARGHRVAVVAPRSLHERFSLVGAEVAATSEGWMVSADDVTSGAATCAPDVLVVDYMLTEALCGARRVGCPSVALVHTLYGALLLDGAPNPIGMAGPVEDVNEVRAGLGLPAIERHADLLDEADLVLVAAPPELDMLDSVPDDVVYAGPLLDAPGPDAGWRPPPGDGPLVVVSTGTAGDPAIQTDLLHRTLAALADLPVRGFVTVPPYIARDQLTVPGNVTLAEFVRHSAVLPHASVLVTHAGLGSVLAALAHGVRLVCLPLGREQPDNARAVARIDAGTTLSPDASSAEIAAAVQSELSTATTVRLPHDPAPTVLRLEALAAARA